MATTSMSVRPLSTMARRTLRPIRPKPLMPTLTVMGCLLCAAGNGVGAEVDPAG